MILNMSTTQSSTPTPSELDLADATYTPPTFTAEQREWLAMTIEAARGSAENRGAEQHALNMLAEAMAEDLAETTPDFDTAEWVAAGGGFVDMHGHVATA